MATVTTTGAAKPDAAQLLYERYYANVYRYALSQLRSPQDAEDAAQNTFLRAFSALQKGTVPENEVAWLFKIAHNVCSSSKLAWLRRRRVETPRDLDTLTVDPAAPESRRDELTGLEDALASMPPRLREAFLLREWQGLSYAEIAERLDTSHSAVETLIFRARKHLAQQLEQPFKRVREALSVGPLLGFLRGLIGGAPAAVKAGGVIALAVGGTVAAKPLVESSRPAPRPAVPSTAPAPVAPAPATSISRPGPQRAARQRTAAQTTRGSAPISSQPQSPLAPDPFAPTPVAPRASAPVSAAEPLLGPAAAVPLPKAPSAPVGSTPAPPISLPPVSLPPVSVPPAVTTPAPKTPAVTTPAVPIPTPSLPVTPPPSSPTLPSVPTPDLPSVPSVTVPSVTVPAVTVPTPTLPHP
jgi:RNA polymerase sigma factor (sigma-70 family)